jgi:CubicO group peptidase (beta-lactamase class C family)
MLNFVMNKIVSFIWRYKYRFMNYTTLRQPKKESLKMSFWILLTLVFNFNEVNSQSRWIQDSLDIVVKRTMEAEKVPGLALAVVQDGKVVLLKTYGQRERDAFGDIDENTLFMVGSNTKSLTATSLAMLEYEGKLALNNRVLKFMPEFKLYDPNVTQIVTIRDLLCHRLGTGTFQGDFTFWQSNLSRKDIIGKMATLKPAYDFRGSFGYCNSAFLAAGEIIPIVTGGTTWEQFVTDRIFTPLRMTRTLPLSAQIRTAENASKSHTYYDGRRFTLDHPRIDNLAPAGSVSSSISDWTHWLIMQMDTGRYEGVQVIPKKVILETWKSNTIINPTGQMTYGLGWFISYMDGKKVISHDGGVDGFLTTTAFIPEKRLGVIVFTNTDNNSIYSSLRDQLLQEYSGNSKSRNSIEQASAAWRTEQEKSIATLAEHYALANSQKRRDPSRYSLYEGTYTNPVYGDVIVKADQRALRMYLSNHPNFMPCQLDYMKPHTFLCTFGSPTFGIHPLTFQTDGTNVTGLTLKVNDFIEYEPYIFTKKSE